MTLSDIERHSALWKKIDTKLQERMEVFRQKNDADLNDIETAKLRGRIAMIKEIAAWGDPPHPAMAADE
jgi:hypothetical protein